MSLNIGEDKLNLKLEQIANFLVAEGKGILCADENIRTFAIMFQPIQVRNKKETRRAYREILFTSPRLSRYISGVLLSEEAMRQKSCQGVPFPELLASRGLIPGVTIDKEFVKLPRTEEEWVTRDFLDITESCKEYYQAGCKFTRLRCNFHVDPEIRPTTVAITTNCMLVAKYASMVQAARMVPIVEAILRTDTASYSLERSVYVLKKVLTDMFNYLRQYGVHLGGTVLRVNMTRPGGGLTVEPSKVAAATALVLRHTVPAAVAGITFLGEGSQTMEEMTVLLDLLNRDPGRKPWPLTFSFGRPLQAIVLYTWLGLEERVKACQFELWKRAKACSQASIGAYELKKNAVDEAMQDDTRR